MNDQRDGLLRRTLGCGEIDEGDAAVAREVVLTGWVHRRRDLGQLIFVEMRDATGFVQVVFDPSEQAQAHRDAEALRAEFVIGVRGSVVLRESPNPNHPTGSVEVRAAEVVVHNRADNLAFGVADEEESNEEIRLTHRYLDLRRPILQQRLRTRHRLATAGRRVLDQRGFVEVETPILTRSTPEGARDYLVPSRVQRGRFYALPQSPQLFKQLLMVSGFEKYFQFARCFRDEDLRADRQPEFTQIDLEMSFVRPADVYEIVEEIVVGMFEEIGVAIATPFPKIDYGEAMARYGTDRPDTRFGLEIRDPGPAARETGFRVFDSALESGGAVRAITIPGAANASRKELDLWSAKAKKFGAGGLVWIKLESEKVSSSALKVLGEERCRRLVDAVGGTEGDVSLFVADELGTCQRALGTLRLHIAAGRGQVPVDKWNLTWVERFPLFEWDAGDERWASVHHPFTAPLWQELDLLETDPGNVYSQAYDLVLNGTEIGGGSVRIHRRDIQQRVFAALRIDEEEARAKFGFLLSALDAGAPPHGGIALGFDRICAMLSGADSIRDVIAFPKTTSASCLMTRSPSPVDALQLDELGLRLQRPETDA